MIADHMMITKNELHTLDTMTQWFHCPVIVLKDHVIHSLNKAAQRAFDIRVGNNIQSTSIAALQDKEHATVLKEANNQASRYLVQAHDLIVNQESYTLYVCSHVEAQNEDVLTDAPLPTAMPTANVLIQQEKLAGIGQMAAGVAHEIFNPLGYILSNFETLKQYFSDLSKVAAESENKDESLDIDFILEDIDELFDDVSEGLHRVISIISSLKGFVRESDEILEYDLNEGIRNTLVIARNEYKYHATVETDFQTIDHTYVNGNKINQVLLNLLINAVHAIVKRHGKDMGLIRIKTYQKADMIGCQISDNGSGIPADKVNQIFQPFFTTKPEGVGTGLGLSIAWDIIVEQTHGVLDVQTKENVGTTFTIEIPVIQAEVEDYE